MAIDNTATITETAPDGSENEFEITASKSDHGTLVDDVVDALFDDGNSELAAVYADTDGDGKLDAGAADTDADGKVDTVVGDTDGDGKVDTGMSDSDGDGKVDVVAVDTDGDGLLDVAAADTDGDGEFETLMEDANGDGDFDASEIVDEEADEFELEADAGLPTESEISTDSVEFTVGEDGFPITDTPSDPAAASVEDMPLDGEIGATPDGGYSTEPATPDPEAASLDAHADAAREAQSAADEFATQGDYAAAAEARETAENEAYAAGDSSMLGASDSSDMENAAWKQEVAEDYRTQQAEHIAGGDYEAAKEDAQNAAYATGDADYLAGGSDHTGQSDQDVSNLDNAVWNEKQADYFEGNAEWYAEAGNADAAQSSLDHAGDYQATADTYADHADPLSTGYDVDASSAVASGGSYGAGGYDVGGYDASLGAIDTGFDAGADMSTPSYDTTSDDTV